MSMEYVYAFGASLILTYLCSIIVLRIARRFHIFDVPDSVRKKHVRPTPLLGGVGIFIVFASVVLFFSYISSSLIGGYLREKHIVGILIAGLVIVCGGVLDDRYRLRPRYQIIFPIIAALIVIASGIGIEYISNPFGDTFSLIQFQIPLFTFDGLPYHITIIADIFAFLWLMGMMYTTKILDGIDGLVSGLTVIASIMLFLLSLDVRIMQPETALLSIILAGCFSGFLFINFHPARGFLGESGSLFSGFMIGVLAIISGGKIASALLILSIPIVDLIFVIIERLVNKQSPFKHADTKHLHYKLQELGLSVRKTVLIFYAFSIIMGIIALRFNGKVKIALLTLFCVIILVSLLSLSIYIKKRKKPVLE